MTTVQEPVYFLLVDDLEENLTALEALLKRDNLVMLKATSGNEALELLLQHDIALALLDVQMPGMDGYELAEHMRGMERTKHVPIVFLTAGLADQQRQFRGYEAGAVAFLQKPLDPHLLKNKANVFFELRQQQQQISALLEESQKYAEALKVADQRKDEFLANMSHEIRTPMNAVIGIANLMEREEGLSEKQREMMKTLQSSADSLLELINDLLDISKIEAGSIELEKISFDIRQVLNDVVAMMSIRSQEKGLQFKVTENCHDVNMLVGDPTRIKQVLMNLCSNAVKFTDEGIIEIHLDCIRSSDEGHYNVRISVIDTGIGISPDNIKAIFEKFTQADNSISRQYGGTGLGLAITKQLVEIMQGTLEVESVPGKGSTFTATFPLKASYEGITDDSDAYLPQNPVSLADSKSHRVMLVEDYAANVLVATSCLEIFGYDYDVIDNGADAVERAKEGGYLAILMDVQMPGMNGFEATAQIREYENANNVSPTPIIGMTAHALAGDRERCLEAGMDDYLSKPFNPDELHEKLTELAMR